MPDPVFLAENINRMEQKNAGFFGGSDDSENNFSVCTGQFKGLVRVFNEERKAKRTEIMNKLLASFKKDLASAYEL